MRSFIVASVIFLLTVTLILVNSFYVLKKTDALLGLCSEIGNQTVGTAADPIEKLLSEWLQCRDKLSLSVSHSEIDRAESALYSMMEYYLAGNRDEFEVELSVFRNALTHIADKQKFSLGNIF